MARPTEGQGSSLRWHRGLPSCVAAGAAEANGSARAARLRYIRQRARARRPAPREDTCMAPGAAGRALALAPAHNCHPILGSTVIITAVIVMTSSSCMQEQVLTFERAACTLFDLPTRG